MFRPSLAMMTSPYKRNLLKRDISVWLLFDVSFLNASLLLWLHECDKKQHRNYPTTIEISNGTFVNILSCYILWLESLNSENQVLWMLKIFAIYLPEGHRQHITVLVVFFLPRNQSKKVYWYISISVVLKFRLHLSW